MPILSRLTALFLLFLTFHCLHASSPSYDDFKNYQYTLSKTQVEYKINHYLKKDIDVEHYYSIDDKALSIYPSLEAKRQYLPEFILYFGDNDDQAVSHSFKQAHAKKTLQGLRIALDPGHLGGPKALLEERYIDMETKIIEQPIRFNEGMLALETAQLLRKWLTHLGAEVFLTREHNGQAALSKDFDSWYKEDFVNAVELLTQSIQNLNERKQQQKWWQLDATLSQIFRSCYNFLDTQKRAELVNDFQPDLVISIHYNLGGIYHPKTGKNPGTHENYTYAFIPGAFRRGHLKDEVFRNESLKEFRDRYEFVRLIVTKDLEDSLSIAKIALNTFSKHLDIPILDKEEPFLTALCLKAEQGLYHRNLTLTRLVHAPILYIEPLYQDNFDECLKLSERTVPFNNTFISQRIVDVAEAYLLTILTWAETKSN